MEIFIKTLRLRIQNLGKYFFYSKINLNQFRLTWMKVLNKYWDSELCLTKIKVNEKFKQIGFDSKNGRLAIVTFDRSIYFVDLP